MKPIAPLARTMLALLAVLALSGVGAAFATQTAQQATPSAAAKTYGCPPNNHGDDDDDGHHGDDDDDGHHGDDDDDGHHSGGYGDKSSTGGSSSKTYTTTTGGSHGDDDDDGQGGHHDDCPPPPCPTGHGDDDDDGHGGYGSKSGSSSGRDCDPCKETSLSSKTSSGGSHGGGDDCDPCKSNSISSKTSSGGSHGGDDDCEPEKPGCGPDKTDGVAGNSGRHDGQPPKADDRKDCPNPPGQQKQIATTGGSGNVKATSASIAGTINPKGNATTGYFEFGKGSLGSKTAAQSMGNGSASKSLGASLSGLTPNATYSYRVVANSSKGTVIGDTKTFKTAASAPTCVTGGASAISKTGAKLDGSVNPGGGTTTGYFEYGKTPSLGSKTGSLSLGSGTTSVAALKSLSGLSKNTKYYFRLVASNSAGSITGATGSFSTVK